MIEFCPFPNIKTKKLILRRMNYNDINDLFKISYTYPAQQNQSISNYILF